MTRDEASKLAREAYHKQDTHTMSDAILDIIVALGLLKLDEPNPIDVRFCDAIRDIQFEKRGASALWGAIHGAGLKIVEAD